MTLARDAALAVVVLGLVLVAFVLASVPIEPVAFLVGALVAVAHEVAASARATDVRRVWSSRRVRASALAMGVVVVALAAVLAPTGGLSALAGALVAYLALVALVAGGVLPPSSTWFQT